MPKRRSRHCFRSAIHHLEMAAKIEQIDPAMAAFRCLTAEEEAASGLMHSLKERGYRNSDRLKPRDHLQKNAISPFLNILGLAVSGFLKSHEIEPAFHIKDSGDGECLHFIFKTPRLGEDWIYPIPPLNFSITCEGKPISYKREIDELVHLRGVQDIRKHLDELANRRNSLLYATDEGYPSSVDLSPTFFQEKTVRVLALIRAHLLIQPYSEELTFVQDSLSAFLAMLGRLESEELHSEV
jgi:hypothetical protein